MKALVTGAGGAIGGAIARQLLDDGWSVVAHDLDRSRLQDLDGNDVELAASDLALAPPRVEGPLDAVVAAHGIEGSRPIADTTDEWVDKVMTINAASCEALLKAALPAMQLARRASFVVVASQAGLVGEANNAIYSASKFALTGWALALADHLRRTHRIELRVLCPGCTESPLLFDGLRGFARAEGVEPETFIERRKAQIPAGRFATAAETAAAAVYLADPRGTRPRLLAATGGEVLR